MKKTTKIIAIYADTFNGKVGQTFAYTNYFSKLGFVRLVSAHDNLENLVNEVDVLVIPGGADVNALRYGAVPGVMDGRPNQHYEYLDSVLIDRFVAAGKPIIGICRGLQTLNVHFGGTLTQHITGHHQGDNRHKAEEVVYLNTPFNHSNTIKVNTLHHQCIGVLGEGLEILGYGSAFGETEHTMRIPKSKDLNNYYVVPEIIKHTTLPIIAFQYHPEEFDCVYATTKILELIR